MLDGCLLRSVHLFTSLNTLSMFFLQLPPENVDKDARVQLKDEGNDEEDAQNSEIKQPRNENAIGD